MKRPDQEMTPYTLSCFGKKTGTRGFGKLNLPLRYLLTDTRQVSSPDDSVFFAVRGKQRDGHAFLEDAYRRGIRQFVLSSPGPLSKKKDCGYLVTGDPLVLLQQICSLHRRSFTCPVIGITGSNGKTIVKEWLYQILAPHQHVVRSPKSYNSQTGVPLSVWLLTPSAEVAIFEAGISERGEMQKLENIIRPDIGIFTNIGEAHQQNFSSLEEKVSEKMMLFRNASSIICCSDHLLIAEMIRSDPVLKKKKIFTWSFEKDANLRVKKVDSKAGSTRISGICLGKDVGITIPFTDQASVENAMHVWSALLLLGIDEKIITEGFPRLSPVAMRLEIKKGINNCTLINDSYNSDLVSLTVALEFLKQQNQHPKRTLILSDIFQSGKRDADLYREVSSLLKVHAVDRLIAIGPSLGKHRQEFDLDAWFFDSTGSFITTLDSSIFRDEAVLIKGSRDFQFENISALLEEKVHQTVLEIDLHALVNNFNYFRSRLDPDTRIMVMVKALSYGSGTYEVANILQYHRADYLAVAFADEGVALREAGIRMPIMVMNPDEKSFEAMMRYQLEPEIYNFAILDFFTDRISAGQMQPVPVHIKLDTGMHRLGFMPGDMDFLISRLRENPLVSIRSVFSHLAASEDPVHDRFSIEQAEVFTRLADRLENELGISFVRHILNSAGIERFPQYQFGMVRLGIGLYGISSIRDPNLVPVTKLKTTVSQVKHAGPDSSIGYGLKGKSGKGKKIAILPIGYADGLDRRLGNGKGTFLVKGKKVKTIGNICMDMCMIDITGTDVSEGDEVIIFGPGIPVEELAEQLDTITYEIMTGISQRVKRIYYQE